MSDLRKAAEMALEVMSKEPESFTLWVEDMRQAREALRQALAQDSLRKLAEIDRELGLFDEPKQPEQDSETVMAKYEFQTYAAYKVDGEMKIGVVPEHTAWVTAGKHTVPLETAAPVDAVNMSQERVDETAKNRHEPVAIVNEGMGGIEWLYKPLPDDTLLYAAPQKREWQGLTDEEREQATGWSVEHIESYLKEKNNG